MIMNISATLNGENINIISIDVNGSVVYIDDEGNLKKKFIHDANQGEILATGCVIN